MSVFADRLIGVVALVILALFALIVGYLSGQDVSFYVIPVLLVFFLCSFGMLLIFNDRLAVILDRVLRSLRLSKLAAKLDDAYQSIHILKDKPRVLLIAFLVSILLLLMSKLLQALYNLVIQIQLKFLLQ